MPYARKHQVALDATPLYHCYGRCVRQQFLCGLDQATGKDFTHRRAWIYNLVTRLSAVFAIDVCSMAVMSNHYHLVLWVDQKRAKSWSNAEVAARWTRLFKGSVLLGRWQAGEKLSRSELESVSRDLEKYRARLKKLSWFMRCLNEPIARWANSEDGVTGRFWDGRYRCKALLDEAALVTAMSYVDLNPIRAGTAKSPEASDFTSIQARLKDWQARHSGSKRTSGPTRDLQSTVSGLLPFADQATGDDKALPVTARDYFELIDASARVIRNGKSAMPASLPPILQRLGIDPDHYCDQVRKPRLDGFYHVVGSVEKMKALARTFQVKFLKGQAKARRLFPNPT